VLSDDGGPWRKNWRAQSSSSGWAGRVQRDEDGTPTLYPAASLPVRPPTVPAVLRFALARFAVFPQPALFALPGQIRDLVESIPGAHQADGQNVMDGQFEAPAQPLRDLNA